MHTKSKQGEAPRRPVPAPHIREQWTRLSQAHVAIHGGCSCGGGLGHVGIAEFERDILDYLATKYGQAGDHEATALLRDAGTVWDLLGRLDDAKPSPAGRRVLDDLARSIDSLAQLHRN